MLRFFWQTDMLKEIGRTENQVTSVDCVFVDEAQFLTRRQVSEPGDVADELEILVVTYGLRTEFLGDLSEGSRHLLACADVLSEIKTICHCGRKATMVLRVNSGERVIRSGEQIRVGGNESYVSVWRRHFRDGISASDQLKLPFEG